MTKLTPLPESFLRARRALLLDHPFFGSLIMHLEPRLDPSVKTIWVDGQVIGFNPTFFDTLPLLEGAGVLAHEVLHCALEHQLRRGDRNPKMWNDAADYVTNPIVLKSGLPLPKNILTDPQYEGKAAEEVYTALNTQKPQPESGDCTGGKQGQTGPGQSNPSASPQKSPPNTSQGPTTGANGPGQGMAPKPGSNPQTSPQNNPQNTPKPPAAGPTPWKEGNGPEQGNEAPPPPTTGEVRDAVGEEGQAPSPAETQEQDEEWKIAVQQAVNNAKGQGFFPAELDRVVKEILTPKIDWREELRRFFQSVSRSESTWRHPNRRFIGAGLYLPGMRTETAGPLVVGIDTSGSIGPQVLEQFAGELNAIVEDTKPERVYVVYCDARVQHVEEFTADDLPIVLQSRGGGGTDFRPVFDWVEQQGVQPDALIYLTDMMGSFPMQDPGYPVVWGSTGWHDKAPFGDVINIKEVF